MGHCKDCAYFYRDGRVDEYGFQHYECRRYPKM